MPKLLIPLLALLLLLGGGLQAQDVPPAAETEAVSPMILKTRPSDGASSAPINQPIVVRFNVPVVPGLVESAFFLYETANPSERVRGGIHYIFDFTGLVFTPLGPEIYGDYEEMLRYNTTYTAGFEAGAVITENGAPLVGSTTFTFTTVPGPNILSTFPYDGQMNVPLDSGFTIYFQSRMRVNTLENKVIIEPEPVTPYETYYSRADNSYTLAFLAEPSTDYTITILPEMADVYFTPLSDEIVVQYRTMP